MLEMIQKGGPVMWPIVFCSVVAFAIFMERLFHLRRAGIDAEDFIGKISSILKRNRIMEAIEMCDSSPGPVAHIIKAGILKHDRPRLEIREAIEDAAAREIPRLEKNLSALATIAYISPLLGLLGTVTGMVKCFQVIQEKSTSLYPINPSDLAGGIWEALINTAAGLLVAIPGYVAYNYLVSRADSLVFDMEKAASELMDVLSVRGDKYEI